VVSEGFDALIAGSPEGAVATWTKSWKGEDGARATTLVGPLQHVSEVLGQAYGYDLVKAFDIGPHLRRLYFIVRCERQPLYVAFTVYQPQKEWQVTYVLWNSDGAEVFPKVLLEPTSP
jgi:hypothetical protein